MLAAAALAVAAFPFRARWWGGFILAIAEAGVVGGLADWFAVTALFRHPLGIPIPHTALIPANWQLMAARVGGMVGGRILTTEYVTREISRVDVASLLAQAAARIKPADVEPLVATIARWAAAQLPAGSATELVSWMRQLLLTHPISPVLAEIADVAHRNGWDQRLVEALARTLVETLDRPDVRDAVGELVDEVVGSYRQRMGLYPGFLIRVANLFGLIDRDRLVSALRAALAKVANDPNDPLRRRLSEALAELPGRLRTEPDLAARVEATKTELLTSPALSGLIEDAAARLSRALVADLDSHRSELVAWITSQIERARETLVSDEAVRMKPRPMAQAACRNPRRSLPESSGSLHRARCPCARARGRRATHRGARRRRSPVHPGQRHRGRRPRGRGNLRAPPAARPAVKRGLRPHS